MVKINNDVRDVFEELYNMKLDDSDIAAVMCVSKGRIVQWRKFRDLYGKTPIIHLPKLSLRIRNNLAKIKRVSEPVDPAFYANISLKEPDEDLQEMPSIQSIKPIPSEVYSQYIKQLNLNPDHITNVDTKVRTSEHRLNVLSKIPKYTIKRMEMHYNEGCTDKRIAELCNINTSYVSVWRAVNNLESNFKKNHGQVMPDSERTDLWHLGYTDDELAVAFGITKKSVAAWRSRYGFAPNKVKPRKDTQGCCVVHKVIDNHYYVDHEATISRQLMYIAAKIQKEIYANEAREYRNRYGKKQKVDIYSSSFEAPVKDKQSLYCDTEFLEKFFGKSLKKGVCDETK